MTITPPLIPSQTIPPDIARPLEALIECVCTEMGASGAGPPCWCGLVPGLFVPQDYCSGCDNDHCGMAWIRIASVFPYSTFPAPVVDLNCVQPLAAQVEVGALRCISVEAQSPEESTESGMFQLDDAFALWRAISCCEGDWAIGTYQPIGPQGGCVGGFWTGYLAIN